MKKLFLLLMFLVLPARANQVMFGQPVAGTATTSSAKILNQNGLRTYLIIVNTGSNTLYVKFGTTQTGAQGIPIPAGGNYEPFEAPASSVYVDTASSTTTYVALEGQ